jgi:hypothetical protein
MEPGQNPPALLIAIALGLMACSEPAPTVGDDAAIAHKISYDFRQPDDPLFVGDEELPLNFTVDGRLDHAGKPVDMAQVEILIENQYSPEQYSKLDITPAGAVKFGDAVAQLYSIAGRIRYELIELKTHSRFVKARSADGKDLRAPAFVGPFDQYELPVVVGYDADTKQCVASLDKVTLGSEELYDRSFLKLDTIVQRAGGIEALIEDKDKLDSIRSRLQARASVPWRCIAGAMSNVERSGWPVVSLEVIETKQTSN